MSYARVAFLRGKNTPFNLAIKAWTFGPYSHVELLLDDTLFSAIPGVGSRFLRYPTILDNRWDFVDIPADQYQIQHMHDWCMSEMDCLYDWQGVWYAQVAGLRWQDPDRWFCSEFVAAALNMGGLFKTATPWHYSPNSLYRALKRAGH